MNSIHEDKKFQCPECDYKGSRKDTLNVHIKTVHKGEGKVFACHNCTYRVTRKSRIRAHVKTFHTTEQVEV